MPGRSPQRRRSHASPDTPPATPAQAPAPPASLLVAAFGVRARGSSSVASDAASWLASSDSSSPSSPSSPAYGAPTPLSAQSPPTPPTPAVSPVLGSSGDSVFAPLPPLPPHARRAASAPEPPAAAMPRGTASSGLWSPGTHRASALLDVETSADADADNAAVGSAGAAALAAASAPGAPAAAAPAHDVNVRRVPTTRIGKALYWTAEVASWLFNPFALTVLTLSLMAAELPLAEGSTSWFWGASLGAYILAPVAFLFVLRLTGGTRTLEIKDRNERPKAFLFSLCSSLVGVVILLHLTASYRNAAPPCVACIASAWYGLASLITIALCMIVNVWWKISIHLSGAAMNTATLFFFSLDLGALPGLWFGAFIIALLIWARITVHAHTPLQTIVGTMVGSSVPLLIYTSVVPVGLHADELLGLA